MASDSVIETKTKAFALRIIKLYRYLCEEQKETLLSKQVLMSGTAIGAKAKEAECTPSKTDFYAKLLQAYKEANQTEYWLELLHESGYLNDAAFASFSADCAELIKLLASIKNTQKKKK